MNILKVEADRIIVLPENGFIETYFFDEHSIPVIRDVWGVPRFPLIQGYGNIQFF